MKKSQVITAALAAVCLASLSFAYTPQESAVKSPAPAAKIVPSKVVGLTSLPLGFVPVVVNVEFSVDQLGQPRRIRVLDASDRILERQVLLAFSQWRFAGPVGEASASKRRFILPIEIVPEV